MHRPIRKNAISRFVHTWSVSIWDGESKTENYIDRLWLGPPQRVKLRLAGKLGIIGDYRWGRERKQAMIGRERADSALTKLSTTAFLVVSCGSRGRVRRW